MNSLHGAAHKKETLDERLPTSTESVVDKVDRVIAGTSNVADKTLDDLEKYL